MQAKVHDHSRKEHFNVSIACILFKYKLTTKVRHLSMKQGSLLALLTKARILSLDSL